MRVTVILLTGILVDSVQSGRQVPDNQNVDIYNKPFKDNNNKVMKVPSKLNLS